MRQFRNVEYHPPEAGEDSGGSLTGEHDEYGGWMRFSASVDLAWIKDALDTPAGDLIWDMQDGYGIPGFNAGDWSGIRDSSPSCVAAMWKVAREAVSAAEFFGRRNIPIPPAYQEVSA